MKRTWRQEEIASLRVAMGVPTLSARTAAYREIAIRLDRTLWSVRMKVTALRSEDLEPKPKPTVPVRIACTPESVKVDGPSFIEPPSLARLMGARA